MILFAISTHLYSSIYYLLLLSYHHYQYLNYYH